MKTVVKMKFKIDDKDLRAFEKGMRMIPDQVPNVISKTLNYQATSMQNVFIPDVLEDTMEIRNPKFMKRMLWVNFAKKGRSVANNFSEVGSLGIDGSGSKGEFTGWEEQQTGAEPDKNRVVSEAARTGGSFKGKVSPKNRMNRPFRRASEWRQSKRVKSKAQALFFMLKETQRQKINFVLNKNDIPAGGTYSKFDPGLYGWKGGKLLRLQRFDEKYDIKTTKWMTKALDRMVKKKGGFEKVFARGLEFAINKSFNLG